MAKGPSVDAVIPGSALSLLSLVVTGATTLSGGLILGAGFVDKTNAITGNTTLTVSNSSVFANATSGSFTITLPTAATAAGLTYAIYKMDASTNTVTIDGSGSETIGGALTVVLGGNTSNSRLIIISDGANWQIKELYEEGAYTATLTGCTTSPTATVSYVRNGKTVSVRMSTLVATSNTTTCTITGMPSHLWPVTGSNPVIEDVRNNTLSQIGLISISTVGVWSPYYYSTISTQTNTFTAVGTKGVGSLDFTYSTQ